MPCETDPRAMPLARRSRTPIRVSSQGPTTAPMAPATMVQTVVMPGRPPSDWVSAIAIGVVAALGARVRWRTSSPPAIRVNHTALPIETAPANPPGGDLQIGPSRTGKAIRFPYHGAFDAMDSTYELVSNYIDTKNINAEDLSIEEYVTDPATASPSDITINIYMPLKP